MKQECSRLKILSGELSADRRVWLVTGAAGFIGSHLLEFLLSSGQEVIAVDNFSTGSYANLRDVKRQVGVEAWDRCRFYEGDVCDTQLMQQLADQVDLILHQAALGSVPRSIKNPHASNNSNVGGFLSVAQAACEAGINRVVYASSSSVYGDSLEMPKREDRTGNPISPYAASKAATELYAAALSALHETGFVGLRYFNVFGPRQAVNGPYAAVIPRWINRIMAGAQCEIFGDGETSRDFCFVKNVVQANILAALSSDEASGGSRVYNIAAGKRTSLNELFSLLVRSVQDNTLVPIQTDAVYREFREGDVRHSLADIDRAVQELGYVPEYAVDQGVVETVPWYLKNGEGEAVQSLRQI